MQVTLAGKVAVVTGAASGIGLAIVKQYLASGIAGLVAVDLAPNMPTSLTLLPQDKRMHYVGGDVGTDDTAKRFTETAITHFGKIDILVNNAGINVVKPLHLHTLEEWDLVMNTNVKAMYFSGRHILPIMMKQKSGVILNTGSISGETGIPTQGAYGPSKGAVHEMTRQLAIEYAPYGIRVNAIGCGTIDTPLVTRSAIDSGNPQAFMAMLKDNHPIGRIASAEEVASFFTYMASDLASFFTGAVLMMDGGYSAK
jgi:NAD(P)-dependent dehydrogenase (short-subunit alcohol dehydrogenase family)